jgi:hypothetical protein
MAHGQNYLLMAPNLCRKAQKNTVDGKIGFNAANFSVTFKRQGEKKLE